jgi:hypothetical protein
MGYVNTGPITATVSGAGALTFTNWPTGDTSWIPSAATAYAPLTQATVPAGTGLNVSGLGITSGHYAYVMAYLSPPATSGGTATALLYAYAVGGGDTSVAAAVGHQVVAQGWAAPANWIIAWDGIVLNTGGVYSIVAGGGTSGLLTTGRDRRPWARGADDHVTSTAGDSVGYSSGGFVAVDPALSVRVECSGAPLRLWWQGTITGNGQTFGSVGFLMDGAQVGDYEQADPNNTGYNSWPVSVETTVACTPGSHLVQAAWRVGGAGETFTLSTPPNSSTAFGVQELLGVNAGNGTS